MLRRPTGPALTPRRAIAALAEAAPICGATADHVYQGGLVNGNAVPAAAANLAMLRREAAQQECLELPAAGHHAHQCSVVDASAPLTGIDSRSFPLRAFLLRLECVVDVEQ